MKKNTPTDICQGNNFCLFVIYKNSLKFENHYPFIFQRVTVLRVIALYQLTLQFSVGSVSRITIHPVLLKLESKNMLPKRNPRAKLLSVVSENVEIVTHVTNNQHKKSI